MMTTKHIGQLNQKSILRFKHQWPRIKSWGIHSHIVLFQKSWRLNVIQAFRFRALLWKITYYRMVWISFATALFKYKSIKKSSLVYHFKNEMNSKLDLENLNYSTQGPYEVYCHISWHVPQIRLKSINSLSYDPGQRLYCRIRWIRLQLTFLRLQAKIDRLSKFKYSASMAMKRLLNWIYNILEQLKVQSPELLKYHYDETTNLNWLQIRIKLMLPINKIEREELKGLKNFSQLHPEIKSSTQYQSYIRKNTGLRPETLKKISSK